MHPRHMKAVWALRFGGGVPFVSGLVQFMDTSQEASLKAGPHTYQ